MRIRTLMVATAFVAATVLSACGGDEGDEGDEGVANEENAPGDIPDNIAFIPYTNAAGHYTFTYPEGWAKTESGSTVTFTDKLNGVHVETGPLTAPPDEAAAKSVSVPALMRTQPAFELKKVGSAKVAGATGVRIVYRRDSAPDPVSGRIYHDEVERYELVLNGHEFIIELYGPVGSDNVDPYKIMIDSMKFS
ncbi:MAG TPA: PsbP-related protein [Sporichthya sp.]|nr:PsbP-related protein [Sporichthya sp.]